jgi:hypothetical protein
MSEGGGDCDCTCGRDDGVGRGPGEADWVLHDTVGEFSRGAPSPDSPPLRSGEGPGVGAGGGARITSARRHGRGAGSVFAIGIVRIAEAGGDARAPREGLGAGGVVYRADGKNPAPAP